MSLHPKDEEALDTLDAMVMSGDSLSDPAERRRFREFLASWERQLKTWDEQDEFNKVMDAQEAAIKKNLRAYRSSPYDELGSQL